MPLETRQLTIDLLTVEGSDPAHFGVFVRMADPRLVAVEDDEGNSRYVFLPEPAAKTDARGQVTFDLLP